MIGDECETEVGEKDATVGGLRPWPWVGLEGPSSGACASEGDMEAIHGVSVAITDQYLDVEHPCIMREEVQSFGTNCCHTISWPSSSPGVNTLRLVIGATVTFQSDPKV